MMMWISIRLRRAISKARVLAICRAVGLVRIEYGNRSSSRIATSGRGFMRPVRLCEVLMMRWLCFVGMLLFGSQVIGADRPPNVIFILADDLGYTDLGCYGSQYYETPNIDRLAAEGVRFTDGHTCGSNCQPSRAALLSGQYGPRTGVYTVGHIDRFNWQSRPLRPVDNVTQLPFDKVTIADTFKKAGYATGMFGKWHLGNDAEHHPSKRGFDEAIVSAGEHFDFKTDPKVEYPEGQYLADFLTERALEFIETHKGEPFFLYLPHFGVHSPHQAKQDLIERFADKPPAGGHDNPTYAAMIASVDESVGRILAALDQHGLAENTLVIFSSDNGGVGGYESIGLVNKDGVTDNGPLKGGKGTFYEGGTRVPFIFRWKGTIEPGQTENTPIIGVDLYPTFVELAGANAPPDYTLDGISLAELLKGERASLDREALYWHFPGYLGASGQQWRTKPVGVIRSGDWKLMEQFEDGKLELYNLKDDIGETRNLAESEPEKTRELHAKLAAWRKSVGAKMPGPNTEKSDAERPRKKAKKGQRKRAREREAA
jgi:arylsulfatase A-like enzyme